VAGLGALGVYSSSRASAQASGQIGTASDPVDVEAYDLNVQNQLAGDLDAGGNSVTNADSVSTDEGDVANRLSHPIEDPNDVTDLRSLDIEYQNTTGEPIIVDVQLVLPSDGDYSASLRLASTSGLGGSDEVANSRGYYGQSSNLTLRFTVSTVVPDGHYYTVSDVRSSLDLDTWVERGYTT